MGVVVKSGDGESGGVVAARSGSSTGSVIFVWLSYNSVSMGSGGGGGDCGDGVVK